MQISDEYECRERSTGGTYTILSASGFPGLLTIDFRQSLYREGFEEFRLEIDPESAIALGKNLIHAASGVVVGGSS